MDRGRATAVAIGRAYDRPQRVNDNEYRQLWGLVLNISL